MMKKLVFATNNAHKLHEVASILKDFYEVVDLKDIGIDADIPETGNTLEENALIKARYVWESKGISCFADDTGLEVEALNNEPGVYSARYAGENHDSVANMEKLLRNLHGIDNRKARFRTVVAAILDGKEYLFEGVIEGSITKDAKGHHGFGYDPVFLPNGYEQTFAELGDDVKNTISHRALAVKSFCDFLQARETQQD